MKARERWLALVASLGVTLALASGCNSLIGADAPNLVASFGGSGGTAGTDAGTQCLLNSACPSSEICVFRVCSQQCVEDKDCAQGRCLPTSDGNACVVPTSATCSTTKDCPSGSACLSGACRTACTKATDCLADQTCTSGACVGTDSSHDPPLSSGGSGGAGTAGTGGANGGGSGGRAHGGEGGAITGGTTGEAGMGGEGGTPPECEPTDVACSGLTPLSCQGGQMKANGANCQFACANGACNGECNVGDKACDTLTFEACGNDNKWVKTGCPFVCDATQGCVGNCTTGTFQCNGTTELDQCANGKYVKSTTCAAECAVVNKVAKCIACGDSDGICPPGCTDAKDVDCPKEPGETCTKSTDCRVGVCGAEGVCCDSACGDSCSSCKISGKGGTCTAIDFSHSSDTNNCGSCHNVCSTNHVTASCTQGVCGGTCATGYATCDSATSNDGCETIVATDPNNCNTCGTVCKYGECTASSCAFTKVGPGPDADSLRYGGSSGAILAAMPLNTISAGKVAALGVLATVGGLNVSTSVYLALYTDGGGFPNSLVAETGLLTTVDAATVGPTEGAISPAVTIPTASYWLVIMSSAQLRLHTVVQTSMTTWYENSAAITFGKLTGALPGTPQSQMHPPAIGYAIIVP